MIIKLDLSSNGIKVLLLATIVLAVLFVLISPLPEPDSTGPKNILIAVLVAIAALGHISIASVVITLPKAHSPHQGIPDLLATLCSRQC